MLRHSLTAFGSTFVIDSEYQFIKELGQSSHGSVIAAKHRRSGEGFAIRKIANMSTMKAASMRYLREIKILAHFSGHKNIAGLYDLDIVFHDNDAFDIYLFEELMEADLRAILHSGQPLTDYHFQSLVYQALCGLKYIHSANVLHGNLKPGDLLVNSNCDLKICHFGLSRCYIPGESTSKPTETPEPMPEPGPFNPCWYRAPETMPSFAYPTPAIDIWSLGCIFAELLRGTPFFRGRDYVDQLNIILHYLGSPTEDALGHMGSPRVQDYIRSLPVKRPVPFSTLFPQGNPLGIDLLSQMLCLDPAERVSSKKALNHPYLQVWYEPEDMPSCETKFDLDFETGTNLDGIKKLIIHNIDSFRDKIRAEGRSTIHIKIDDNMSSPIKEYHLSQVEPPE
ncbi:hypothetical protein GALMADRAFT_105147 [Galerina marginata CBS 339.88]|uniref:Protein kinase domain-containing protein n=1 Tax=Galerina marginata (strain CBS 339.88) TaxID=685588 RepID=A0A067SNF1_GALM3|nr:hypothetical protein GALMADRAFT_105147 [Galerina marginata CBS 339.88]